MNTRRTFLAAAAGSALASAAAPDPIRLGLVVGIDRDTESAIKKVRDLGLPTCFVYTDDPTAERAARLRAALEQYKVEATAVESLGPGQNVWDFMRGPTTIGLVPRRNRQARIDALKRVSDWAKTLGIRFVQTHCGFIPEDPNDPLYGETVKAVRDVASHCGANGQSFAFETGQETPITLMRTIADIGLPNVGVGFDTGNLILYGKANPADAVEIFGKHVMTVHAKDGLYPTDPRRLGTEVAIGSGKVDFRAVIRGLRKSGYAGALSIEREISGPRQLEDVRSAKVYLERILAEVT